MLGWPGVVDAPVVDPDALRAAVLEALAEALDALIASRQREGAALRDALLASCVYGREDPARVWAARTRAPLLEGLASYGAEGRGIATGLGRCSEELDAVVHALNGGNIRPAYGADPVRGGAAALPSGRNIHGISSR